MGYKVIIVDDEELARLSIKSLLDQEAQWEVVGEAVNGIEAAEMISRLRPDLVFLDVEMPKLDGISMLKKGEGTFPHIILTTAYSDFALQAFDLSVTDYLLKPYTDQRFFEALNKVKTRIDEAAKSRLIDRANLGVERNEKEFLTRVAIKSLGKIQLVDVEDVIYIQATGNYTEINTYDKKYLHNESLTQLEEQLDPGKFIRIHRSTIVRISEITELESHMNGEYIVHTKGGDRLKLSRSYKYQVDSIVG